MIKVPSPSLLTLPTESPPLTNRLRDALLRLPDRAGDFLMRRVLNDVERACGMAKDLARDNQSKFVPGGRISRY